MFYQLKLKEIVWGCMTVTDRKALFYMFRVNSGLLPLSSLFFVFLYLTSVQYQSNKNMVMFCKMCHFVGW